MDRFARLEALGLHENIEGLSVRFGLPYVPEYELASFRGLRRPELAEALEDANRRVVGRGDAEGFRRRGRLRRAAGDLGGALADFQRALDLDPRCAGALAGLGEAALERPEAETTLSRALELSPEHPWARLYRGAGRLLAGRVADAREDLECFAASAPGSALGFLLLGAAEERLKSRERAAKAYERAFEKNPVCSAAALLRSRAASSFEGELAWFHRAYDVSPVLGFMTLQIHRTSRVSSPAYVRRMRAFCFAEPAQVARHYQREAATSRASYYPFDDRTLVRALLDARQDAWIHAFYGRASCYSPEGAAEGLAHLSRAAAICPSAGWIRAWRGNAKKAAGDADGAQSDFEAAIRLQPHYHRSYVWRAGLLTKKGRSAEALKELDRALPLDPRYPLTYFERARARRAEGDFAGAAVDLERAFSLDERYDWARLLGAAPSAAELASGSGELSRAIGKSPSAAVLRVWRGHLRLRLGPPAALDAILDFERAAELEPLLALAHAWAGRALMEGARAEAAVARLRRALALDAHLHPARMWLADALAAAGRRPEARKVLAESLRDRSLNPQAFLRLARIELDERRPARAEAALAQALRLDGKYAEAYLLLARARLERGEARGSLEAAEHCLAVAPNLGRAYLARAGALGILGRAAESVADYRRVLSEFPYLLNDDQRASAEAILAAA